MKIHLVMYETGRWPEDSAGGPVKAFADPGQAQEWAELATASAQIVVDQGKDRGNDLYHPGMCIIDNTIFYRVVEVEYQP